MNDLINRQEAIEAVEHITSSMSVCVNTDECHGMKRMQRQAVIELANLPTAEKVGKWIDKGENHWRCSECNTYDYYAYVWDFDTNEYKFQDKYCPNCGARMKGEADE